MTASEKYPWLWDVEMDSAMFNRILAGEMSRDGLDWSWAMARLADYAPYDEIRRLLPRRLFLARWHEVAPRVRSPMRREGMDYLHERLSRQDKAA